MRRILILMLLLGALPAAAQGPTFHGVWKPTVGKGAVYQLTTAGKTDTYEVSVVGQEQGGYWLEMYMASGREGPMIMKQLLVEGEVRRMIVKSGQQPAMELPVGMSMPGGRPSSLKPTSVDRKGVTKVGREKVKVPAGTFTCDHYRSTEGGQTTDVWVQKSVSPYGLVKMTGGGTTMVLQKVVKDARTRITEKPQKMQIPGH